VERKGDDEMRVAITGATGFLGRYIVHMLVNRGHTCRCWHRPGSDRSGFEVLEPGGIIEWVRGGLGDIESMRELVSGTESVVHAALDRPGAGFRGAEGDLPTFLERNVVGTIRLIETARSCGASRFIFISTCAVHEVILEDRKLDEAHPLWPTSHYGAHKAAIEKFIHSYGLGQRYDICALRPTGIYGIAHPPAKSKWYDLVQKVKRGERIASARGGKEVHASDVARAVAMLLTADSVVGQAYNCCDMYIAEQDVAAMAKEITGSPSTIKILNKGPKHQIDTSKLRALGMEFGGRELLKETVRSLVDA
jgi:nucleoside-diphosphate-sugar epimerase